VLKKAIAVYPENRTFSLYLAAVFNDQGKFDEVYPIVDEVLAEPETTDLTYNAYVEGIKASLNSGDTEKTNTYVEAMIARFPDEYAPMLIQHLIEVQLGTPEKANAVADAVTENSSSIRISSAPCCRPGSSADRIPRLVSTILSVRSQIYD